MAEDGAAIEHTRERGASELLGQRGRILAPLLSAKAELLSFAAPSESDHQGGQGHARPQPAPGGLA
jgi:hypothetical protein